MGIQQAQPQRQVMQCRPLTMDNDVVTITSLSDSEEEKLALAAQPATPQPIGTRFGNQYLRQYNWTPDETQ